MLRPKTRRNLRSLYQWHRHVGLIALLLLIVLAVTGLLINHTERLGLDSRYIDSGIVLDWYGIEAAPLTIAFKAGDRWISEVGDRLYMNTRPLADHSSGLTGAVKMDDLLVVAIEGGLLLLTLGGELVERLGGVHGVPAGLQAIGLSADGHLLADAAHGVYVADPALLGWRDYTGDAAVIWSRPAAPPPALVSQVQRHQRTHILPLERMLLDLHSGRILGSWGVYVMDAAALLLIFLGLTGSWLWCQQFRKQRLHHKTRRQ